MTLEYYQKRASETDKYPQVINLMLFTLGLTGEAGEVADKVKKLYRDDNGELSEERRLAIAKELGDVLWYIARIASKIDYTLEEVGRININKLAIRHNQNKIHGDGDER